MTALVAPRRRVWPILIAPALVIGSIALLKVSNDLVYIGPWDRATFGWAIPIPMLLIAPAVAGLVARWTGQRRAMVTLLALAASLGLFLTLLLTATIDRIGCEPVADKLRILAYVAPVGIVAGGAFAAAGWVSLALRARPIVAAVASLGVAIAGGVTTLLVFAMLFPGVSCAPGPAPA